MKLATVSSPAPTYPITIQNDFNNYHAVPNDYTLVAKRTAGTDIGTNAEGSTLTTTYAAYISKTQPADTYTGKVRYTLVHPNDANAPIRDDQVEVIYHNNDLGFASGRSTNRVVYGTVNTPMYIDTTPTIVKTSNIANDGTQNGPFSNDEYIFEDYTYNGASKIRVELKYGLSYDTYSTGEIEIGDCFSIGNDQIIECGEEHYSLFGNYDHQDEPFVETYTIEGDTVVIFLHIWDYPGMDDVSGTYGMYAQVYPMYETEQPNTEETSIESFGIVSGAYAETTTWNGKWYGEFTFEDYYCDWDDELDDEVCVTDTYTDTLWFNNQNELIEYITDNEDTILGTTIHLYAYNPYKVFYDGNGATAGTMSGFYTAFDSDDLESMADLMAPNFYKTGYGFAGWSENPNATVNSNYTIYGPNESVNGSDIDFNSSRSATLYAVWVPSSGNMQNFSCSTLSSGQVTALTDTRDNNVYTVGKMQDGNCWMMENLRLDDSVSAATMAAGSQGIGSGFTKLPASSNPWPWNASQTDIVFNSNNIQINNNTLIASPGVWDGSRWDEEEDDSEYAGSYKWYSYGNYYSWPAAIADTTSYSEGDYDTTSICPTGWQIPLGSTSTGDINLGINDSANKVPGFSYLDRKMGGNGTRNYSSEVSNRWRSYPNNFVYSCSVGCSAASGLGAWSNYWTATAFYRYGAATAVYFSVSNGSVGISSGSAYRSNGYTVRCVTGS